jgi:hypothetical protein
MGLRPQLESAVIYEEFYRILVEKADERVNAIGADYDKRKERTEDRKAIFTLQAECKYRVEQECVKLNEAIKNLQWWLAERYDRYTIAAASPEAAGVAPQ